jgi:pimeloyl-ACP methyl ester carboxylesterase
LAVRQLTQSVLFIHGLFVNYQCWDEWVARFTAKGYLPIAQAWPGRDKTVAELRSNRDDAFLGRLTLSEIIEAHVKVIRSLPEPPILIGHSLGGLIVQVLLNRGMGAAGIAIDSAPPQGVFTTAWSFLRCNWPLINPTIPASTPYLMSPAEWQYALPMVCPGSTTRLI